MLQQVGLVHVLERVRLLADRDGQRRQAHRAAGERLGHAAQDLAIDPLQAEVVHLEQLQRLGGDLVGDRALVPHLGEVAHAAQDAVGHPRGAARAAGDLAAAAVVDLDPQDPGRAADDLLDLLRVVVVEPVRDAEAVAQRRGQQAGASGRADQRERRQVEPDRVRAGPLADHDVDAAVLHGRVQQLLDRAVEPVDLVDEQHVVGLERGQDRGHVGLAVDGRAGHDPQRRAHLGRDDAGQRGLAEARRPRQQHVLARLAAGPSRLQEDRELLLDRLLADELRQPRAAAASGRAPPRRAPAVDRGCDLRVRSCARPGGQRLADPLTHRQLGIDAAQRRLGLGHRHAQPHQPVAGRGVVVDRRRLGRASPASPAAIRPCP